jgi:hypothetical protein
MSFYPGTKSRSYLMHLSLREKYCQLSATASDNEAPINFTQYSVKAVLYQLSHTSCIAAPSSPSARPPPGKPCSYPCAARRVAITTKWGATVHLRRFKYPSNSASRARLRNSCGWNVYSSVQAESPRCNRMNRLSTIRGLSSGGTDHPY